MVSLIVVLIVLGCAALQYLKGTLVQAFAAFIITICASVVAFAYFEVLANVFIGRELLIPWAQLLSFVLLFILTFAILRTLAAQLSRQPIDLGLWPERIGRVVCGILLGLVLSSLLLTALAIAPIPNNYPYQRFDQRRPDAERPNKVLLNTDGLAAGLFSTVSSGSFSGKRSFATLHPAFIDQLFLNRHNVADDVSIVTSSQAIEVPRKRETPPCWLAPEDIKDSDGNPVSPKSDHNLTFVRVGIKKSAVGEAGTFALSQLRLICKQQAGTRNPLAGKGQNIYPIGCRMEDDTLQIKRLNDVVRVSRPDFEKDSRVKWIDFAFYVPAGSVPVLLEFKQNSIAEVPPPVTAEQAPPPVPFLPSSEKEKEKDTAKPNNKPSQPPNSKRPTQPKTPSKKGGLSPIGKSLVGPQLEDYK